MSYNISNWKTRELNNLTIPLSVLQNSHSLTVQCGLERDEAGHLIVNVSGYAEGFEIQGVLKDDAVLVDEIESWGEGSGTLQRVLLEVLNQSQGKLKALLVWEGGDHIEHLIVENGSVREVPLDD